MGLEVALWRGDAGDFYREDPKASKAARCRDAAVVDLMPGEVTFVPRPSQAFVERALVNQRREMFGHRARAKRGVH